jgi:hypothetical protein
MKLVTINIKMDSAAFIEAPGVETARILRSIATAIDYDYMKIGSEMRILDINGNTCGFYKVINSRKKAL